MQELTPNLDIDAFEIVEEVKPPISEATAREYFRAAMAATAPFDNDRRLDAAYFHNKQIPAKVQKKWMERGQPLVWTNKVDNAINGVLGIYDAAQTAPKFEARNPAGQNAADTATKVLRYLNDRANMRTKKATASKDYFIYGTCAFLVGDDAETGSTEIDVRVIRWRDFFHDPASIEHDFSDASYMGICLWLDESDAIDRFPDKADLLKGVFSGDDVLGKNARPSIWAFPARRQIRIVELYFRDENHEWQRVVYCERGFLDFGPSQFVDDMGNRICPILAASFEVDDETGERYGPIAALRPLQDEYNSRRAVLLNEAQNKRLRQLVPGASKAQIAIAKREAAKADGVLPPNFDMVSVPDIAAGQAALLQKTEADFDRRAPSSTVLSAMRGQDSGRARQILQNAGLTEWARAFFHLEKLEERVNRHLWFGARQFMTTRQFIRVTGDARASEFIEINKPIDVRYEPTIDPTTGQPLLDEMGMPVMKAVPILEKALAEMDGDIILDSVPDSTSLQQEANEQILKYAEGMTLDIADPKFRLVMELFLTVDKARQLDRYDAAIARMNEQNAPMIQMQQQMQEMQQRLAQMEAESKAQKNQAQARKADAEATRTEIETQIGMPMQPVMPPPPPFH